MLLPLRVSDTDYTKILICHTCYNKRRREQNLSHSLSLRVWFIVSKNLFVVAGSAFARDNGTDEECVLLLDVFFVKNIFLKMASVESLALDACLTSHRTI